LLQLSTVFITTVAVLSLGYLSVDIALSYVTQDTAGVSVQTVRFETEKVPALLSYELKDLDTGTSLSSGVVPSNDSMLPFTDLTGGTRYILEVYDGNHQVRSFLFQTTGNADMIDLLGDWDWVSYVGTIQYPQIVHFEVQDLKTGRFSGTDVGAGRTFTFTGRIVGATFVMETDGGGYHATSRGVVRGTSPNLVMTGTFTDSNNAVGTFTAYRMVP
jgi:hypothetical protein